jgi:hypothetical protein
MNCGVARKLIDKKKPGWLNAKPGVWRESGSYLAVFLERPQAKANRR